ncbi:hypothetical protein M409DRAFT_29101 [Zasmidium cellare ATCC 36951]|uniref:Uncharacterized protein n=1 Tax=Zasmidium cellare ATCC 36951 TaxID=1080233 RepID=A0A6A6C2R4_ZASCE|nr:uncharacterized protein M409DRAFT_29101 [Zasmidium cellare ATCC 36951]KAF2160480.1 hypothetical protein M409DRAFT_29101 [Zasmidium cellare ATCC 36951]
MSGKYVPPGRRGKLEDAAGEKPPSEDESLWETDNIIFTKSSLHLLPAQLADDPSKAPSSTEQVGPAGASASEAAEADKGSNVEGNAVNADTRPEESPAEQEEPTKEPRTPIAVFKHARKGQVGRFLRFDGWYQIEKLAYLAPESPELVKMLEKKWNKTDRFGNARPQQRSEAQWRESLRHRWAVLKLKKDEDAEKELGVPKIGRLPELDPESPKVAKKTVNEMLAEMRMGGQGDQKTDSRVKGSE